MESALEYFIREKYREKYREQERVGALVYAFVKEYPINRIENLSLNEYLISKEGVGNPNSYCRRIG